MNANNAYIRLIIGFFTTSARYLFQAFGVVIALVIADYLATGADVRLYSEYFVAIYGASMIVIRVLFPMSRLGLQYSRTFYRFIYWFTAVIASIFSPSVLLFVPYLTLAGIAPKVGIVIVIVFFLSFIGVWIRVSDLFRMQEDRMVAKYQKAFATPDYERILSGEEFEHHPEPVLTRWQRLKKRFSRQATSSTSIV